MLPPLSEPLAGLTIAEAVAEVRQRLEAAPLAYGHGCSNAHDEAVWLVAVAAGISVDRIDPESDAALDPIECDQINTLLQARITERVPLAYLAGEAWLAGRRFYCDPRALVPRSPIAELLEGGLAPWVDDPEAVGSVLDLCCGSASLGILAAQTFPNAAVTAADISAHALALAADNLVLHQLEDRVRLVHGDLWAPLEGQRFDLILCNPPYVDAEAMAQLPLEWQHEPTLGLAARLRPRLETPNAQQDCSDDSTAEPTPDDGLDCIRAILAQAAEHLSDRGVLILEIGHQVRAFETTFPRLPVVWLPVAAGEQMIALLERSALRP